MRATERDRKRDRERDRERQRERDRERENLATAIDHRPSVIILTSTDTDSRFPSHW